MRDKLKKKKKIHNQRSILRLNCQLVNWYGV